MGAEPSGRALLMHVSEAAALLGLGVQIPLKDMHIHLLCLLCVV